MSRAHVPDTYAQVLNYQTVITYLETIEHLELHLLCLYKANKHIDKT